MGDLIDRQAAIDALGEKPLAWTEGEYELGLQNQWQSDVDALNGLPSAQPERKTEDFEKGLHDMFDHIWNCEIEHPMFQDTVGELMQAVIQLYRGVVQPCEEGEQDDESRSNSNAQTDTRARGMGATDKSSGI